MTHAPQHRSLRLALVSWSGGIGGAENFAGELAAELHRQGLDVGVVFAMYAEPLGSRLTELGVPHVSLGLPRGRAVIRNARRLAEAASRLGPDAAILPASGFLAAALRLGGYRGRVIAVDHGASLQSDTLPAHGRLLREVIDRASGIWACSAEVAVSEYLRRRVAGKWPRSHLVCIPNGVDLDRFCPGTAPNGDRRDGEVIVACGQRLAAGKGVDDLIRAVADASGQRLRLRIAGDGAERPRLEALARSCGAGGAIEFVGDVLDMPTFWRSCDIAAVPSNGWIESFGMVAVEAMACGKPVVATTSGALPEVVTDGCTGQIVPAGDVAALSAALTRYARDTPLRRAHGVNARRRCEQRFGLDRVAGEYVGLCHQLVDGGSRG